MKIVHAVWRCRPFSPGDAATYLGGDGSNCVWEEDPLWPAGHLPHEGGEESRQRRRLSPSPCGEGLGRGLHAHARSPRRKREGQIMTDAFARTPLEALRVKWGWFVALGLLLLGCSFLAFANLFIATVVSVYYVGMLMLFGGVVYLVHAFQV